MSPSTDHKIVVITRSTRLTELVARFNTVTQARFYVEHMGLDFSDYQHEDQTYREALQRTQQALAPLCRVQVVDRRYLPNFVFGPQDVVVALGQDGLVANTLKYLSSQPLLGVNPDPGRWDGQLLPFVAADLPRVVPEVFAHQRPQKHVSMAIARLNNGQSLLAVNDLFIGVRTHTSARYQLKIGNHKENHSSSGLIVSTGLGSTGWFKSLLTGATRVARSVAAEGIGSAAEPGESGPQPSDPFSFDWSSDYLYFTVREPFPSKNTGAELVFGRITPDQPLTVTSHTPENGVIFSDGIEADFLEFNSGSIVTIQPARQKGTLVV